MPSPPRGRRRILGAFGATAAPLPRDIALDAFVGERARSAPDRAAIVHGDREVTWAELDARANHVARALVEAGVGRDVPVALLADRSPQLVAAIFGVWKAGGAYLPLSPADPPARIERLLAASGTRVVIAQQRLRRLAGAHPRVLGLEEVTAGLAPRAPDAPSDPRGLAYVMFTSGSTGEPKGVLVEHRSVVNRLQWMQRAYRVGADDVILHKAPLTFDVSVWELFLPVVSAARLALLDVGREANPHAIAAAVQRHGVTLIHFVPSMLHGLLGALREEEMTLLSSLRRVFCSGEALSGPLATRFDQRVRGATGAQLTNLYGPTEATVDVTSFDCPPGVDFGRVPSVSIGRPIDNVEVYVVQGEALAPTGAPGELCIGGAALARGYLGAPELTARSFAPNPFRPGARMYRTGDLARWRADGDLDFCGRADEQVKIRGMRVEPGEVEQALLECAGVEECVVVARRYGDAGGVRLVAYVVVGAEPDAAAAAPANRLREHLRARLPEFMVPSGFVRMERLPRRENGKVDRAALPEAEWTAGSGARTGGA